MKNKNNNDKVYIITYREEYSNGEVCNGICYVYDTIEKAKNMLEIIKKDEIAEYKENGYDIVDDIKNTENGFIIDRGDFTEYEITEMNFHNDKLEQKEKLLNNCIDYIMELWGINNKEEIVKKFKDILGFSNNDIKEYEIDIEEINREEN